MHLIACSLWNVDVSFFFFFSCDCAHERYTLHSIYSDNDDNEWNSHERDYVRLDTVLTRTLYNQISTVLY